ncbi:MAG: mandelate racemase/muconate lactonizing enzyme family protein [Thermomicrobiales bacterium]|nr:mandelate racemase/muconate lactonizing enzyme family protein [Thermomicrobiales bacterium]
MKITDIEAIPVSVGEGYAYAVIVVLIRTDEGLTGIGEASLGGRGRGVLGIIDHARDLLIGQDPSRIEHCWAEIVHGTFWSTGQVIMSAVAGIDIALWDLKGKRLGVPVYDLLGGATREKIRVYRHLRHDNTGSVDREIGLMVEDAHSWVEQGFTVLRFDPLAANTAAPWNPSASIMASVRGAEALRKELGDDIELLFDAHTMFSPIETIQLANRLEPYRLFFYEDPIRPFNAQSLRMVRQKTNAPLATGEQFSHKWEFQPLIEEELVDYHRIDVVHAGGITEAKKILGAAEIHGQKSALHHASSPINGATCLHIDAAIPNFGIQEWMELPALYELFPNAPRAEAGYVQVPTGPGLGLEFDEAEARRRPSRDAELPHRYWPDGSVADY